MSSMNMSRLVAALVLGCVAWAQAPSTPNSPSPQSLAANRTGTVKNTDLQPFERFPQLPSLPGGAAALLGGTISRLDRVRDEVTVLPFGGSAINIAFDARTQIYRDGQKASERELQAGQKVYVDTVLEGDTVFAKSIRVLTKGLGGESRGQVLAYDAAKGELRLNDPLFSEPVTLLLAPETKVMRGNQTASLSDLRPGTLVAIKFRPESGGALAQEVSILAAPGGAFIFAGRVSHLDLRAGVLVLVDPRDKQSYAIHFDPARMQVNRDLREGADVTLTADFDGTRYVTSAVKVNSPPGK